MGVGVGISMLLLPLLPPKLATLHPCAQPLTGAGTPLPSLPGLPQIQEKQATASPLSCQIGTGG